MDIKMDVPDSAHMVHVWVNSVYVGHVPSNVSLDIILSLYLLKLSYSLSD